MATSDERQHILNMIAEGTLSAEQGAELLAAMDDHDAAQAIGTTETPMPIDTPRLSSGWWTLFWIGTAFLIGGAMLLAPTYQSGGATWLLLACGWPTFLIGLLLIVVAWFSRSGPWVHIRVKHAHHTRPNIHLSVPLNLGVGVLRIASPFVPQLKDTGVDDLMMAMKDNVSRDRPLVIDVNEDDDGEHIQVVVG
jgi:hypothetical protein